MSMKIENRQQAIDTLHRKVFGPQHKTKIKTKRFRCSSESRLRVRLTSKQRSQAREKFGLKFDRLRRGEWASDYKSQSEADLAYARILTDLTTDPQEIDDWFRGSGLYREKWDERHSANGATYGEMTLNTALTSSEDCTSSLHSHQEPNDQNEPIQTVSWSTMTKGKIQPIAYHWEGWVPQASVCLMAGAGESFKSWLALYLACMTAAGQPALAPPDTPSGPLGPGPVLYITAENSLTEEKRRCQLLQRGLDLSDDLPIIFVPADGLSLRNERDYTNLLNLVKEHKPTAVFIDSAIALSDLDNESNNPEVRKFMKTRIAPLARKYGATVYLLVHSPKPPTRPGARFSDEHVARGASDWRNAADVMLYLRHEPNLGPHSVVLRHAKTRIGHRHVPIWFALEDVEAEESVRLVYGGTYDEDSGQGSAVELRKAVFAAIRLLQDAATGLFLSELESLVMDLGSSKATTRRALALLRGKIGKSRRPWPFGPHQGAFQAVVTESKEGRKVIVTLDPSQWTFEDDENVSSVDD